MHGRQVFDRFLGGRQGGCPSYIGTYTKVGPKTKGKLLFKKGEIYCGGNARWTLAHRWMSTPSLVEIGSMHTKLMVDLYLKNSKFLTLVRDC